MIDDETPDLFSWNEAEKESGRNPGSSVPAEPALLIDAFSQIFRAFFAIRALNNCKGEPVNALFVFTRLLLQLEQEHPGRCGAMLFDCGKVPFRLALNPEYKANRPPMPEELRVQMPKIEEMSAAFGWRSLRMNDYEADDLAGAFAAVIPGEVLIVTGDKDLSSLVDDRVKLLKPGFKGGFDLFDRGAVIAKFGVPPELIPDYLALVGDTADNIPGVPGIGPKTAAALLNEYGAVESWYEGGTPKFAGSKQEKKLAGMQELLKRNLALVRLKTELPPGFADWKTVLQRDLPDWEKIARLCAENNFNSLQKEIPFPFPEIKEEGELF